MPIFNALNLDPSFPTYILPSLPFRRRSSTATTTSAKSTSSSSTASNVSYLPGHASILRCSRCLAHLCSTSQIISKGFTGRFGKAYLVAPPSPASFRSGPFAALGAGPDLPNTHLHKALPRQLVTGPHVVSDISCKCGNMLGWKYVAAEEEAQKYKVGKVILETKRIVKSDLWEANVEADEKKEKKRGNVVELDSDSDASTVEECEVEFDSQDEDECEDLFLGVWSEALARKRRRESAWRKEH